jgi:hypothetical protein
MVVPPGAGAGVRGLAGLLLATMLATPAAAQDTTHLLILSGLDADAEHGDRFFAWASALVETARTRFQSPPERIVYLADKPDRAPDLIAGRATRDAIEQAFADLAGRAAPTDVVFIVLFGHGTSDGRDARFNLPGPDMSAADFRRLLDTLRAERVVFVNTTSASGDFVKALSGPRRTILTATRTAAERFDTQFGGFFVEAFASDEADANKDRRVSVLEAFGYARSQVQRSFEQAGFLQTEHALLDDDGDGEGTQEPEATKPDGRASASLYLGIPPLTTASGAPITDPAIQGLYQERVELERRIQELAAIKDQMPPEKYEAELERLGTDLALKNREIRQREAQN